jgi:uncharacterized protein YihD (DUF1040 family)
MSEHLKVLFYILCEINKDIFYIRIIESVKKIPGILSVSHVEGTNIVEVSAEWNTSEYDVRIKEIRKIAHVKRIEILKKTRHVSRGLREYVEVTDRVVIKTAKVRKISKITDNAIFRKAYEKNIKLKFLILGPGKNSKEYKTHRLALKQLIKNVRQQADFPVELKNDLENISIKEDDLALKYDYIIILLMSTGSVSEFSSFLRRKEIANKIWLFIPHKYRKSRAYLTAGPVKIFKSYYKRVCYFRHAEDLLVKAKQEMIAIMILELYTRYTR